MFLWIWAWNVTNFTSSAWEDWTSFRLWEQLTDMRRKREKSCFCAHMYQLTFSPCCTRWPDHKRSYLRCVGRHSTEVKHSSATEVRVTMRSCYWRWNALSLFKTFHLFSCVHGRVGEWSLNREFCVKRHNQYFCWVILSLNQSAFVYEPIHFSKLFFIIHR